MPSAVDPLIGRHFHSSPNPALSADGAKGRVLWRGIVLGCPQPGYYLVQLLDVDRNAPNVQRLVTIENMLSWEFYQNKQDMTEHWDESLASGPRTFQLRGES